MIEYIRFSPYSRLAIAGLYCLLTACSHVSKPENKVVIIDATAVEQLGFKGKGAGAGVALMSVMGPVGIAIGSAIDAGIGNEINEAALAAGFDLKRSLLAEAESQGVSLAWQNTSPQPADQLTSIIIRDMGFRLVPGSDDMTVVHIEADCVDRLGQHRPYSRALNNHDAADQIPLEQAKVDGVSTSRLVADGIKALFNYCKAV